MSRIVTTFSYFIIYDEDKNDNVWESESVSTDEEYDRVLLRTIDQARRILYHNPSANISIGCKYWDECDGFEDGDEGYYTLCDVKGIDALEKKVRK